MQIALRVVRLQTGFFGRLNLAEFIGLAAVLDHRLPAGRAATSVSIGTASAAALYFINLFGPVNEVLFLLDDAQSAAASLARLVGVADLPARPAARRSRGAPGRRARAHHGARPRLLPTATTCWTASTSTSPPGERVALVGAERRGQDHAGQADRRRAPAHPRADPDRRGAAREQGPAVVRQTVALVTQEVHVFAGPLADDLRLARPDATDDDLRAALAAVDALDWADAAARRAGHGGR